MRNRGARTRKYETGNIGGYQVSNDFIVILTALLMILVFSGCTEINNDKNGADVKEDIQVNQTMEIELPAPRLKGDMSIEETLAQRRSIRSYSDKNLSLTDVSQLLWAAQGVTSDYGFRTAPSAGALYPLEIYLIAGRVTGLESGVYNYRPATHSLVQTIGSDRRNELYRAALSQSHVKDAAVDIVIAADYSRITGKYGDRGIRYAYMEAGHAAQNVQLQGVSLGIGTCPVGAFDDEKVANIMNLPASQDALYILSAGYF